jgi:hypothetical protein
MGMPVSAINLAVHNMVNKVKTVHEQLESCSRSTVVKKSRIHEMEVVADKK